ncbi:MAG: hypothetical protein AB7G13_05175 [Lautropia sp.]
MSAMTDANRDQAADTLLLADKERIAVAVLMRRISRIAAWS